MQATIDRFNKYRSSEIRSRLVSLKGRELIMEFEASSCRSCGAVDHLEDFAYEASGSLGAAISLESLTSRGESGFQAIYHIGEGVEEGRSFSREEASPSPFGTLDQALESFHETS